MARPSVSLMTGGALEGDSVALTCFEKSSPDAGRLQSRLASALRRAEQQPGWRARSHQIARSATGGARPVQVEVHGLGKRADFDEQRLSKWLASLLRRAGREGSRDLMIILPDHPAARGRQALRILSQLLTSGYRYDRFQSKRSSFSVRRVLLLPPIGEDESFATAIRLSRAVARGVKACRDLGNTPPNEATPVWMAEQASNLAAKMNLDCRVLQPEEMREKGMGGILAVGSGSAHPPRLVRLEWGEGEEVTSFVGKGVTFDTGGISIKPSAAMEEMKYDKCGACTVLGIAQAVADLRVPGRFRAYIPLVENMPDGNSYRPSDIVRCYNGKTVEILNTDAEGRMILADALAWAAKEKPDTLVELSTLTGATVVALGHQGAALYTPDQQLADELLEACGSSGERLWRMPLWPEFSDEMKGTHADLQNLGTRWGSANSAAAFLGHFVGATKRWAHLDIAGTAYTASKDKASAGATGFGVALILDWLLRRSGRF